MAAALSLGPSFAISPKVTSSTVGKALCGLHQYGHRLRWRVQTGPTVLDRQSTIVSTKPFPAKGIRLPRPTPEIDSRIAALEIAIQKIYSSEATKIYRSNLTPSEQKGIAKLFRSKDRLRYTIGDKCSSFVVMPQSMDKIITNNVLSDSTTYCETTMTALTKACSEVKKVITTVVKPRLGTIVAKQLLDSHPMIPTFYSLVKTHKLPDAYGFDQNPSNNFILWRAIR
ncbi:hypothetical protein Y032_0224g2699 [Ancylostoma ceylanicum]|uniref:Uncharacterized protein n=1 Tax=Ancylostoma ceylanicum TaxID=53326 RepID=A0A016SI64_9BILA|nr:hypothetical protein Y032_0224g2699 [Ancylostoma ceylanicum]